MANKAKDKMKATLKRYKELKVNQNRILKKRMKMADDDDQDDSSDDPEIVHTSVIARGDLRGQKDTVRQASKTLSNWKKMNAAFKSRK